jgi:hypothetical protein
VGLTAGPSYYNLVFDGTSSTWSWNQSVSVNNNLIVRNGEVDSMNYAVSAVDFIQEGGDFYLRSSTMTLSSDAIYVSGNFFSGTSLVDLTGSGLTQGFNGLNRFYGLRLAPPAATTTLNSKIDVSGTVEFNGGIVSENGNQNLELASSLANPIVINPGTAMNFTTFTWISSHANPQLPGFSGYPHLTLESNAAGTASLFTLTGSISASTVTIFNVNPGTQTAVDMDSYALNASNVYLGFSTMTGVGGLFVDSGVLNVIGKISFRNPQSVLDLGTSTSVRVGGNFLFDGSTGTFISGTSTVTFNGSGLQYVNTLGRPFNSVYSVNIGTGVVFVSSFSTVNLGVDGLASPGSILPACFSLKKLTFPIVQHMDKNYIQLKLFILDSR